MLDVEDCECVLLEKKLLLKLQESEDTVKVESNWITIKELKDIMEISQKLNAQPNPPFCIQA